MTSHIRLLAFLAIVAGMPALVGYLIVPGSAVDELQASVEREIAMVRAAQQIVSGQQVSLKP